MALTRKEVEELGQLARLALGEGELDSLTKELGSILTYVEKLRALDTTGVEPTTHAVPMDCPLREDVPGETLPTEAALVGAPRRVENFFAVPKIIELPRDGE